MGSTKTIWLYMTMKHFVIVVIKSYNFKNVFFGDIRSYKLHKLIMVFKG